MDNDSIFGHGILVYDPEPLEAVYRIESTLRSKFVMRITGKDEDGNDRSIALTWDGEWIVERASMPPCTPTPTSG